MNRRLTVTYYTEPQNLKHVSMSLRGVKVVLAVLGFCCAWTLLTFVYLAVTGARHLLAPPLQPVATAPDATEARPVMSVPAAEAMVEASVQTNPAEPLQDHATEDAMAALSRLTQKLETLRAETKKVGNAALAFSSDGAAAMPASAAADAASALLLDTPAFEVEGDRLAASFKIKNRGGQDAAGTVWGVATFLADDGKAHLVPSHAGLDVEQLDHPKNSQLGIPYKAKRLTQKTLNFVAPSGVAGTFRDVKILVSDGVRRKLLVTGFGLPESLPPSDSRR